jgi:hypothetical protein
MTRSLRPFVPSRRAALILAVVAAVVAAIPLAGTVSDAVSRPEPNAETLAAPMAHGGPVGRVAVTGPWVLRDDPGDAGRAQGWAKGAFEGAAVTVPHAANAGVVEGEAGRRAFAGSVAWYRTTIAAAETGSWVLRFESVHHKASVWVDGKLIGQHVGAYLPFEFALRLRAGVPHTLVVRADYRYPTRMKRDGWHRTWFNFGGIGREVTMRRLGDSEVSAPQLHTTLQGADAVVDLRARVSNRRPAARNVAVEATLRRAGELHRVNLGTVHLGPGEERTVRGRARIPRPALWEPGSPRLYDLRIQVPGEAGWTQRVGLRELRRSGSRIELNGHRLELHGASLHEDDPERGDALLPADMDALVRNLEAVGANATRSQHPLSPPLLERLDAAGILTWVGVGPVDAPGAWTSQSPRRLKTARARVRQSVEQGQLHPSIVAWNLVNEVAGNGHDATQVAYVTSMADELHRRDPGRLVALDVWGTHPPRTGLGPIYDHVDAVAVTNYVGWYEDASAPRADIRRALRDRVAQFTHIFAGKVLVISEFGAEANASNATDSPGGYDFQSWLLRRHIATYRAFPAISGMLVWNLRDFAVSPDFGGGSIKTVVPDISIVRGINQKGLFDYGGRPKPAVRAVRRAFAPLGNGLGV